MPSLNFDAWTPSPDAMSYAASVSTAGADSKEHRFPAGAREGAVHLYWPSQRTLVVHGGRVTASGKRKIVQGSLLTLTLPGPSGASTGNATGSDRGSLAPWSERLEERGVDGVIQLVRGPPRWHHAAHLYDESGTLVLHGGKDALGAVRSDVLLFNLRRGAWESFNRWAGGCAPPGMYGHSLVALPIGVLVIIGPVPAGSAKRERGGSSDGKLNKEVMAIYTLDLTGIDKLWSLAVTLPGDGDRAPCARRNFCTTTSDDDTELFVAGGEYGGRQLHDVWRLNLQTSAWTRFSMTEGIPRHLCVAAQTGVLIVSGSGVTFVAASGNSEHVRATKALSAGVAVVCAAQARERTNGDTDRDTVNAQGAGACAPASGGGTAVAESASEPQSDAGTAAPRREIQFIAVLPDGRVSTGRFQQSVAE
jgi:hypothetical protein